MSAPEDDLTATESRLLVERKEWMNRALVAEARIAELEHKVEKHRRERESWVSLARENAKAADAAHSRIRELEQALAEIEEHTLWYSTDYAVEVLTEFHTFATTRARAVLDQKGDADGK